MLPKNFAAEPTKLFKLTQALKYALKKPNAVSIEMKQSILNLYTKYFFDEKGLPKKDLFELIPTSTEVKLCNFRSRDGNVTAFELLAISSIVSAELPKVLLEIGTFDGNTTLQMAANSPDGSIIHTIDLPASTLDTKEPLLLSDVAYIVDESKKNRKFLGTKVASKVTQHYGDSTSYDFQRFLNHGKVDFAFIDGGHSYECVKSDTENVLKILSPNGVIVWHDYNPHWLGVYRYLNELSNKIPIIHIGDTTLAFYKA
jgi:hypothetical protein